MEADVGLVATCATTTTTTASPSSQDDSTGIAASSPTLLTEGTVFAMDPLEVGERIAI